MSYIKIKKMHKQGFQEVAITHIGGGVKIQVPTKNNLPRNDLAKAIANA